MSEELFDVSNEPDDVDAVDVRPSDAWDLVLRDTVPDFTAMGGPSDVGSALLFAMLSQNGAPWKPPYDPIRKALEIRKKSVSPELQEQNDSRFRTWLLFFRELGLTYEHNGILQVTQLGKQFYDILNSTYRAADDYSKELSRTNRLRIARIVGPALARCQLRTPRTAHIYPTDTNIHPLWAIWKAARELDGKLHWDELDRVLTKCLRMSDLDSAIAKIRHARESQGYDPRNAEKMERLLGPRKPIVGGAENRRERNQHDRVIIWLQRAAFRDIFLERNDRPDGYRHVNEEYAELLDELLAEPPDDFDSSRSADEYFEWLGQASTLAAHETPSPYEGSQLLRSTVDRCRQFGDRRIIALVGPAGSGKTSLVLRLLFSSR